MSSIYSILCPEQLQYHQALHHSPEGYEGEDRGASQLHKASCIPSNPLSLQKYSPINGFAVGNLVLLNVTQLSSLILQTCWS